VSDADQAELGTDLKPFSVFRKGVHQSSTKPPGIQMLKMLRGLWPKKKHHSTGIPVVPHKAVAEVSKIGNL
jgi:hypothetical protein